MLPRCETGCAGFGADFATSSAKGRFFCELSLDQPLVIREDEAIPRYALAQLGRPGQRVSLGVGVVGRLAVGGIEVGTDAGSKPGIAGLASVPDSARKIGPSADGVCTCQPKE